MSETTTKAPRGRRPFVPTDTHRAAVTRLILAGFPVNDVAAILSIAPHTLRKHFSRELQFSRAELLGNIAATLYQKALAGDTTAAIFIMKCIGGWREAKRVEVSVPREARPKFHALPPELLVVVPTTV